MALSATIFKAHLSIADMDRPYYGDHPLTLARHPSETDERMMIRLLAFALHADEHLSFTRGLCVDQEPDLWCKGMSGEIELWIEVGLPDEKRLRKACSRAGQVVVYAYGGRSVELWWQRSGESLRRCDNLQVLAVDPQASSDLAALAKRSMDLSVTVQEGQVWIDGGGQTLTLSPELVYAGRSGAGTRG